ncbi:hypothetical protein I6N90_24460 [Paenibacillus sp. GSMTC-2017]|uniref:DUF5808 domain-containing protein n=1 Tax=Paenibacillus sp. GSMTC-2017 TaxID=2794350 RepID=UPI0018D7FB5C|nr:DUF5808 domain-containing protein [Paenibacillus sp. GSMTC-2017]MBH5320943.1 hypothetical protein [Paenibacillus sp. GSMTC-2017]
MLTVIVLIVALISFMTMVFTYKPQAKYKNGMLFAVTLPDDVIVHPQILKIQDQFNKQFTSISVWLVVSLIPLILLHYLTPYQVIYFLLWMFVFFIVMVIPFRKAFRETLHLKRENEWFVGKKSVIQSDLRVARLKNQRSAPLWLFIIPLAMGIGNVLYVRGKEIELLGLISGGLVLTILFFFISLFMRRTKAKVYSMNSEVNVSLNQARRRSISYMWLIIAIVENIHFLLIYLLLNNENASMDGVWIAIISLFAVIPVGIIVAVYRKINALEKEVLEQDGKVIYSDDDEYWANGFTYHNPNDKSLFVTKRIGIGETINTATLFGKIFVGGVFGVAVAVIVGVSFMLLRSDMTSPVLTVTADHKVVINYPMYSFDFHIADIEQLTLVDEVPEGRKTNGEAMAKYSRGQFRLKELGNSRLYIFKNNPPYIRIKLKDSYIFYNEKNPLFTKQLFEHLKNQVQAD